MKVVAAEQLKITPEEYHRRSEVSSTSIRCFRRNGCWAAYNSYFIEPEKRTPDKDSPARQLGRAFHAAMDKKDSWQDFFVFKPETTANGEEINLRKPAHRAYVDMFKNRAAMAGKDFVEKHEIADVEAMILSVYDNPECLQYVNANKGRTEVIRIGRCEETELGVRSMADILHGPDTIVDFKTTKQFTQEGFVRDALNNFGYHFQGAFYLDVFERSRFVIIAVRNEPPWESMVYRIPDHYIKLARESNDRAMAEIAACKRTNSWHSPGWGRENVLDYERKQD